jgi:cysteine desulfuration protein SufE
MSALPTLDSIRSDFELLDDWEDRYRYVIELGRMLEPFNEVERTETNKVRGCASQVWLASSATRAAAGPPVLSFKGDSDAHIVRGLIAVLFALYSERPARDILATDAHAVFRDLGLSEHLTPQRSNGLASMVQRIRADAHKALGE